MEVERLREFVVLAEYLNFSLAARELFIAQSTLSQHIAALEEEVGMMLIERRGSECALTSAGAVFADRAQDVLIAYARLFDDTRRAVEKPVLRIQDHRDVARLVAYFKRALPLAQQNGAPALELAYAPLERRTLEQTLAAGVVDVCFYFAPHGLSDPQLDALRAKGLSACLLYTEPHHLYFRESSPLAHKEPLLAQDLDGKVLAGYNHPAYSSFRSTMRALFASLGIAIDIKLVEEKGTLLYEAPEAAPNVVAFDSAWHRAHARRSGRIEGEEVERDLEGRPLAVDVYAVYDPARLEGPQRRLLKELEGFSPLELQGGE